MPEFIDAYGVAIVYDVHLPTAAPRAVVQLVHGAGEYAGRYGPTIAALTDAGYAVYADDHRGHGRTGMRQHGGDPAKIGKLGPGGHRAAVAAVRHLTDIIRSEHPGVPLVLLGHSWGSLISQILLNDTPETYDLVVLSGTALRWPGWLNGGDLNAPWKGPDAMGTEWLSSDLSVARAFFDDPLTTSERVTKLFGIRDALRLLGKPRKNLGRDVPVLLMVGRDDTLGGPRSVHKLADAYRSRSGLTDVTTLVYPGARHELFNEVMQDEVRADLLAWLDARLPARD